MKKKWIMMATALLTAGVAQAAFVTIGDARNADDTTGYGGVAYEYRIIDHEVTIAEFAASGAGDGNRRLLERRWHRNQRGSQRTGSECFTLRSNEIL